jgi:hypothetical protein
MSLFTTVVAIAMTMASSAQHPTMPPGMSHEEHLKQMQKDAALKKRGADAMGFDQDATVHHFHLSPTGGSITVDVRRPADTAMRAEIRQHLEQIANDFVKGDFGKPVATHAEIPPGVVVMQQRRAAIAYRYEETPLGARVLIETHDRKAQSAVHAFLRYQIVEHKTDDPPEMKRSERSHGR